MSFTLPRPKAVSADEVVLSRDDWDRIVTIFGDAPDERELTEDEDDIAAVKAARAADRVFAAQVETQHGAPVATTIPLDVIKAKLAGAHPIRAWRDHHGWTQHYLSRKSGAGRDLIAQIETRKKDGSVETLDRLARAFGVPMEALIENADR
jgi:DNA-binding XRE family transcriptional regulator